MILNFVRQFIFGFYSKFSPGKYRVDFPKKAVFITGCDSGLGYNFAVYLNSIGVKVFAGVYSKSSPGAKSLLDKSISVLTIDITNSVSVQNASSHIKESIEGNKYGMFDFFLFTVFIKYLYILNNSKLYYCSKICYTPYFVFMLGSHLIEI